MCGQTTTCGCIINTDLRAFKRDSERTNLSGPTLNVPYAAGMTTKTVFALLALGWGTFAAAQSNVVFDVRVTTPAPQITTDEARVISNLIDSARRAGAWKANTLANCRNQNAELLGKATGSFTARNVSQVAYLYSTCFDVPNQTQQGLVVFQGGKPIAHYAFTDHFSEIYGVRDINKNGFSELALIRVLEGQGTTHQYLALAEFQPARRFVMFQKVAYNDCGNMGTEGWNTQVIRVTPAATPRFTQQTLAGRCDGVEAFGRVTKQGAILPLTTQPEPTGWVTAPLR